MRRGRAVRAALLVALLFAFAGCALSETVATASTTPEATATSTTTPEADTTSEDDNTTTTPNGDESETTDEDIGETDAEGEALNTTTPSPGRDAPETSVVEELTTTPPTVVAAVPTTTPTPESTTPAPSATLSSKFVVKTKLAFPFSTVAAFLEKADSIIEVVKTSSGSDKVEILSTTLKVTRRSSRRLLATSVESEFAIGVDSEEAAQAAAGGLSANSLNSALADAGLPAATVVSAARITSASGVSVAAVAVYFVKMAVSSETKLAAFALGGVRDKFRAAAARAAGVDTSKMQIALKVVAKRRAKGDTRVDLQATLVALADAQTAAQKLTGNNLNKELRSEGLEDVEVIELSSITSSDGEMLAVDRLLANQPWFGAMVGGVIAGVVLIGWIVGYRVWSQGIMKKEAARKELQRLSDEAEARRRAEEEKKRRDAEEEERRRRPAEAAISREASPVPPSLSVAVPPSPPPRTISKGDDATFNVAKIKRGSSSVRAESFEHQLKSDLVFWNEPSPLKAAAGSQQARYAPGYSESVTAHRSAFVKPPTSARIPLPKPPTHDRAPEGIQGFASVSGLRAQIPGRSPLQHVTLTPRRVQDGLQRNSFFDDIGAIR